ncbi:MAG: PQQ-binding-like beta-propeller repeat protein [Planctomycetaceae bacterium]
MLRLIACASAFLVTVSLQAAEPVPAAVPADSEWPEFRGPDGQGHAVAHGLPLAWDENRNIRWKVELTGLGWSSPVISGNQIWLTTADVEPTILRVLCLDRDTGTLVHNSVVAQPAVTARVHRKNSLASPTPILSGDHVYVHFGPYATACLSSAGDILWNKSLPHQQLYGPSSTAVLFRDLLIVPCLGTDVRYLIALDKNSGEERWKQSFEGRNAESTPLVIDTEHGPQLVSSQADRIIAFDPQTGRELWWVRQTNYAQVPRPVFGHGLVYVSGGYFNPEVWAIRPDGQGDVTDSHVVWHVSESAPLNPSPILVGDELYFISDNGVASCVNALTGALHWRERLDGNYSASPVFGDNRLYFLNETGTTYVVRPGPKFELLATNVLPGQTLASLAVAGRALYLRTDTQLYRIETAE